jgi:hypothetical protein
MSGDAFTLYMKSNGMRVRVSICRTSETTAPIHCAAMEKLRIVTQVWHGATETGRWTMVL